MENALADLYRHNLWANLRLLDACAGLDDAQLGTSAPGTYGSIGDTLVHIVSAEERYLARLKDEKPENILRQGDPFPGFEELRQRARLTGEGLLKLAPETAPNRPLKLRRREKTTEIPAYIQVIQAINHSTEHRTHVMTILSQLGIDPPSLDGWTYGQALGVVEM
ncbi:MAG: DinB family protein [Chloroflexi bacterium]|nr:DinB family protein [Chloroflexota bacterium]